MKKIDFNGMWRCRTLPGCDKFDVTLPHDWSIGQKRRPDAPSGSAGGYFVTSDLEGIYFAGRREARDHIL